MLGLKVRSDFGNLFRTLVPLQVSITTVVSFLLVAVAGGIVAYDQIVGRQSALETTIASFEGVGENVRTEIEAIGGPIETAVEATAVAVSLLPRKNLLTLDTVRLFAKRIGQTDKLYSLYFGSVYGEVVLVFNTAISTPTAPPRYVAWIIERPTPDKFDQTVYELDEKFNVVNIDRRQNNGYDPRLRPWYAAAMASDTSVQIPPYVYFTNREIGTTVAIKTPDGQGVVGGDVMLRSLSEALSRRRFSKSSYSVIFDSDNRVLADADIGHVLKVLRADERPVVTQRALASIDIPAYRGLERLYASGTTFGAHEVLVDDSNWVIWMSPIALGPTKEAVMSIMAPAADVFGGVIQRRRVSLLIAVGGIALGVILAWLIARRVSNPIRLLTGEAYRLRQFEFGNMPTVNTRTLEVHQLAQAVETLQRSLKDFACYVPSQIVRRLLAGEMTSEIGGERSQVTLLFSDIEGFTAMSEQMTPMELLRDTSEYFTALTEVIRAGGGTIDRFIGDAVMAMWNAPAKQMDHATLACGSVLGAAEVVNAFNARRVAEGKMPFKTRFGVHVGDAVVGNVGSSESMTYTAIGATVNLASRLEGLNKEFGTQILVSEQVHHEIAGRFNTRPVDTVRPVGATKPLVIYELFEDLEFDGKPVDVETFLHSWDACRALYIERRWADAADAFAAHLATYPGDHAAEVMRGRARAYQADPPPDDWDGVFTAESK